MELYLAIFGEICYCIDTKETCTEQETKGVFIMKKNVKGYIALFAGIAAIILICIALFVCTNTISGTSIALHGQMNVTLALIAAGLGVVAIVFGIMSRKDKDKPGPRKAGVIIGVITVIVGLLSCVFCSLSSMLVDYANGNADNSIFSEMDADTRQQIDDLIEQLRRDYPAK